MTSPIYLTITLEEFDNLHKRIDELLQRIALLEAFVRELQVGEPREPVH